MTQPSFVPIADTDQVRPARRLAIPGPWAARRPGDQRGPEAPRPRGHRYGSPGPDQGFALRLARRFEERLCLVRGESAEDVMVGAAAIASRRAALLGRAPTVYDLDAAYGLFGFLVEAPPAELVEERSRAFRSASHDYVVQRVLVDRVPDETLLLPPEEIRARLGEWRSLLAG